jgi:hypothetical protein
MSSKRAGGPRRNFLLGLLGSGLAAQGLQSLDLFEAGRGGHFLYRIPGLVVTRRGSVITYAEARRHNGSDWDDIDIVLRRSTDCGHTFSPARPLDRVKTSIGRQLTPINTDFNCLFSIGVNPRLSAANKFSHVFRERTRKYLRRRVQLARRLHGIRRIPSKTSVPPQEVAGKRAVSAVYPATPRDVTTHPPLHSEKHSPQLLHNSDEPSTSAGLRSMPLPLKYTTLDFLISAQ